MMDDIGFIIGVATDVISGEDRIATAGGIDTLLTLNKCKWQLKVVYPRRMLEVVEELLVNVEFQAKGMH